MNLPTILLDANERSGTLTDVPWREVVDFKEFPDEYGHRQTTKWCPGKALNHSPLTFAIAWKSTEIRVAFRHIVRRRLHSIVAIRAQVWEEMWEERYRPWGSEWLGS
jgi:hypothetical protein